MPPKHTTPKAPRVPFLPDNSLVVRTRAQKELMGPDPACEQAEGPPKRVSKAKASKAKPGKAVASAAVAPPTPGDAARPTEDDPSEPGNAPPRRSERNRLRGATAGPPLGQSSEASATRAASAKEQVIQPSPAKVAHAGRQHSSDHAPANRREPATGTSVGEDDFDKANAPGEKARGARRGPAKVALRHAQDLDPAPGPPTASRTSSRDGGGPPSARGPPRRQAYVGQVPAAPNGMHEVLDYVEIPTPASRSGHDLAHPTQKAAPIGTPKKKGKGKAPASPVSEDEGDDRALNLNLPGVFSTEDFIADGAELPALDDTGLWTFEAPADDPSASGSSSRRAKKTSPEANDTPVYSAGRVPDEARRRVEAAGLQLLNVVAEVARETNKPLDTIFRLAGWMHPDSAHTRQWQRANVFKRWWASTNPPKPSESNEERQAAMNAAYRAKMDELGDLTDPEVVAQHFKEQYDFCVGVAEAVDKKMTTRQRQKEMDNLGEHFSKLALGVNMNSNAIVVGYVVDPSGRATSAMFGGGPVYQELLRRYSGNFFEGMHQITTILRSCSLSLRGLKEDGEVRAIEANIPHPVGDTEGWFPSRDWSVHEQNSSDGHLRILSELFRWDLNEIYRMAGERVTSRNVRKDLKKFPRKIFPDIAYKLGICLANWPVEWRENVPAGDNDRKPSTPGWSATMRKMLDFRKRAELESNLQGLEGEQALGFLLGAGVPVILPLPRPYIMQPLHMLAQNPIVQTLRLPHKDEEGKMVDEAQRRPASILTWGNSLRFQKDLEGDGDCRIRWQSFWADRGEDADPDDVNDPVPLGGMSLWAPWRSDKANEAVMRRLLTLAMLEREGTGRRRSASPRSSKPSGRPPKSRPVVSESESELSCDEEKGRGKHEQPRRGAQPSRSSKPIAAPSQPLKSKGSRSKSALRKPPMGQTSQDETGGESEEDEEDAEDAEGEEDTEGEEGEEGEGREGRERRRRQTRRLRNNSNEDGGSDGGSGSDEGGSSDEAYEEDEGMGDESDEEEQGRTREMARATKSSRSSKSSRRSSRAPNTARTSAANLRKSTGMSSKAQVKLPRPAATSSNQTAASSSKPAINGSTSTASSLKARGKALKPTATSPKPAGRSSKAPAKPPKQVTHSSKSAGRSSKAKAVGETAGELTSEDDGEGDDAERDGKMVGQPTSELPKTKGASKAKSLQGSANGGGVVEGGHDDEAPSAKDGDAGAAGLSTAELRARALRQIRERKLSRARK
ncbi:hypothetical protein HDZ31DRAFT_65306 [Schizophyllum fasciatum]